MIRDGHIQIPKHDWNNGFCKNEDNKKGLFAFLSEQIVKKHLGWKLLRSIYIYIYIYSRPLLNVKVFFPTYHVMYQVSNHVTTLKTKQGYIPSSCASSRTWPPYNIMFELLIVI